MPSTLEWIAYRAAQRLRVSWYFGQKWLSARLTEEVPAPRELKERMPDRARILADLHALLDEDWRNIEQGLYRLPESVVADPVAALRKAGRYFVDLRRVDARRRADANDEVFRSTPPGRYPRYYLQNFHYQTDGWLSRHSAELYDHQVEVLFGGGADAMRRQKPCGSRTPTTTSSTASSSSTSCRRRRVARWSRRWRGCCVRVARRSSSIRSSSATCRSTTRWSSIFRTPSTSPTTRNMRAKTCPRSSRRPGLRSQRAGLPISPR